MKYLKSFLILLLGMSCAQVNNLENVVSIHQQESTSSDSLVIDPNLIVEEKSTTDFGPQIQNSSLDKTVQKTSKTYALVIMPALHSHLMLVGILKALRDNLIHCHAIVANGISAILLSHYVESLSLNQLEWAIFQYNRIYKESSLSDIESLRNLYKNSKSTKVAQFIFENNMLDLMSKDKIKNNHSAMNIEEGRYNLSQVTQQLDSLNIDRTIVVRFLDNKQESKLLKNRNIFEINIDLAIDEDDIVMSDISYQTYQSVNRQIKAFIASLGTE